MLSFLTGCLQRHFGDDEDDNSQPHNPPSQGHDRKVFAHYVFGLTDGHTYDDWNQEILAAQAAGIDGFALNIGPNDHYTMPQLRQAYSAASSLFGGRFVLFLSFDMAAGDWPVEQVVACINEFKDSPAQCRVNGLPFVSTFEGPQWAENWPAVREATGGIYFVPDWSSLGPHGVGEKLNLIDGAFSWAAWPQADQHHMSTDEDVQYQRALRGKSFMAGVSPWFYTRLPQWEKNWLSASEKLWYDRWIHMLELRPEFVQIITWNDYGESSYIYDPVRPGQIVPGAEHYVHDLCPHTAFRTILPHFIAAYKAGSTQIGMPQEDCAIAWYRTTPAACGHDGDTAWGQGGGRSASQGARDVVSILAVTREPTALHVSIGGLSQELITHHQHGHLTFLEVPFDGRVGPVQLFMSGKSVTGPEIRNEVPHCGHNTYNCTAVHI
ncbi:glycoside hydrolase [Diaporthe sp. PMI_573]|nr:glycoside hydrolase [Diaporthaceae sp. PMI_573]